MAGAAKMIKRANDSFQGFVALDANNLVVSSGGGAAALTITADTQRPIGVAQIWVGYSATPTGGSIKIEDGSGTVKWGPFPIAAAGTFEFTFDPPLCGTKNTDMIITAASGGGAVVATVAATPIVLGPGVIT